MDAQGLCEGMSAHRRVQRASGTNFGLQYRTPAHVGFLPDLPNNVDLRSHANSVYALLKLRILRRQVQVRIRYGRT
jgi:hypothetical protein